MPYKSAQLLAACTKSIERINLDGIGHSDSDNVRLLSTKELSAEERADRKLDVLGGFEFIDSEFRILVIEGLGGKGHGVHRWYQENFRKVENTRRCKLLYNPDIRFKHRLYLDFNVTIKKIKLRSTLTEIMSSPDIFLRSKTPQEIYDTLQKMGEMRKFDRLKYLRDYDLFPTSERLLSLERKYGDSLSYIDIHGVAEITKKQRQRMIEEEERRKKEEEEERRRQEELAEQEKNKSAYSSRMKGATDTRNTAYEMSLRSKVEKDFISTNREAITEMTQGRPLRERIKVPEGVEVYMYSGQKLNVNEFQKEKLRKKLADDKSNFYSYSKDHLSLAFPLVNEHEIDSKAKAANQAKWLTNDGFENVLKRTLPYNHHPKKPDTAKLDDLADPRLDQLDRTAKIQAKKVP